jgi:hypothetical protein
LKFINHHKFLFALFFLLFIKSFALRSNSSVFLSAPDEKSGCIFETKKNPDDSLKRLINKDARRASLMSFILPGLGQAYNRKFWKIPIIYAAFGGVGYFFRDQNQKYQDYHNELIFRYANPAASPNSFKNLSVDQLNTEKVLYKKYRDFCIIGIGIIYLINVIDANVSAHLKTFDVSDKLSLGVQPKVFYCTNSQHGLSPGVSLTLNFR